MFQYFVKVVSTRFELINGEAVSCDLQATGVLLAHCLIG